MHKVLIVDDERPARNYIAKLIAIYLPNSKVIQDESAQKALNCLQTETVDLMFVDIEMPEMTGLELLELQPDNGATMKPYVFIITAFRKYEYAVKGFRLGILDYIEKPLYEEKIYNAVNLYLNKLQSDTIELKVCNGLNRIQINSLLAIQTIDRGKVTVYTSDFVYTDVVISLKRLSTFLPSHFLFIKRNCIINVREVKRYNLKARELFIVCQNKEYAFTVSRENLKKLARLLHCPIY
jgi:DNA-binding LytR/AlgR family response regulator